MTDRAGNANFPENRAYWEAAEDGRLLIKRCAACGKPHYYPRSRCPFCGSANTIWETSTGEGRVYSFTIVRYASPPFCQAYVTLDEGPTMLSLIVECDFEEIAIDSRVRVVFRPGADGRTLPMFTAASV